MNRLRVFSIVLLLLVISSLATAQNTPRTAPVNDNFANALPLPIGSSIKIKGVSAATSEVNEDNVCAFAAKHSVWFSFTPELTTALYLSTSGTKLFPATDSDNMTVLGVYSGSELGSLTVEKCGDSNVYQSSLWHTFSAGTTYTIQLAAYNELPPDTKSFYKLKTRVTEIDFGPANDGFENPLMPENWTLAPASGYGVVCSDPDYPALLGYCAFKFEGGLGKSSKLTQTVNIPSGYRLPKSGAIAFFAYYRGMDSAIIGNAKLTAKVVHADGTPPTVLTLNLTGRPSAGAYQLALSTAFLKPGPLRKVKLKATYQSDSGVLMLDYIGLRYGTDLIRQGSSGTLPVPPPTFGF